jgi:hypothetical protein
MLRLFCPGFLHPANSFKVLTTVMYPLPEGATAVMLVERATAVDGMPHRPAAAAFIVLSGMKDAEESNGGYPSWPSRKGVCWLWASLSSCFAAARRSVAT